MTTTAEREGSLISREHVAVTVGSVALVTLMAYQALAVTTAMPAVADALGGVELYALAFAAPLATALIGMALAGGWIDAKGPVRPIMVGTTVFAAGILIAGTASTMGIVALGRGVQGFGSGIMLVALYVLVARVYPEHLRPRVFAAFAAAWVLPAMIGPTVSGLIVEHLGWRWVFLSMAGLVPFCALALRPGLRHVANDGDPDERTGAIWTGRLAWASVAAAGAAMLHLAGHSPLIVAAALLAVGTAGVATSAPRLLPVGTFRAQPGLPSVVALRGIASAAFLGAEVFIPLLLVRERGISPALAGLVLTVGALTWSFGSWLQGRGMLPDRRTRLRVGMISLTVGVAGSALLVASSVPVPFGVVTWGLSGLGMGLVYPTLSVLVLDLSSSGDQGHNTSSLQIADALFSVLALAFTGTVFAALIGHSDVWPYLVGFASAVAVAALGVVVAGRAVPPDVDR